MIDQHKVVLGPLAQLAPGFREEVERLGYKERSANTQMALMAHLSAWLEVELVSPSALSGERVAEFLGARKALGHARLVTPRGAGPLLGYLRHLGVAPEPSRPAPSGPMAEVVERYHEYLTSQRGLAPLVVAAYDYEVVARLFLQGVDGEDERQLATVTAGDVSRFVTRACSKPVYVSPRYMMSALRSFLRFLHVEGITNLALAQAVPSYASWSASSLPKALAPQEVTRLLGSCDRRTAVGRRDYAVLAMLSRLGLRAGEVAALSLEDIDWRGGEVVVHGKGHVTTDCRCPLTWARQWPATCAEVGGPTPTAGRCSSEASLLWGRWVRPV